MCSHDAVRVAHLSHVVRAATHIGRLPQHSLRLQVAKKEGCNLLTGGSRPPHKNDGGFWVQPTVFTDVQRQHTIWREEIFGPVLAATTFRTEKEALAVANDSQFGLGAAVISADTEVRLALPCCVSDAWADPAGLSYLACDVRPLAVPAS